MKEETRQAPNGGSASNRTAPAGIAIAPDRSPRLVAIGASAPRSYPLVKSRVSIGADPANDIVLTDSTVSGKHAEIHRSRRGFTVADLASTNGSFVNGNRVAGKSPLKSGDEVSFGAARFRVAGVLPAASRLGRRIAMGLSLVVLAAIGFVGAEFVMDWNRIEQLPTAAASPSPAAGTQPGSAQSIAAQPRSTPAAHARTEVASPAPEKPAGPEPQWLADVNRFRTMCALARVEEDPRLSDADRKHAIYLVKNYGAAARAGHLAGSEMHSEDPSRPYYTPEGKAAAAVSDINQVAGIPGNPSPMWAIGNWMSGPFHRLWILNPALRRAGYGQFCEASYCVAALDLGDGIEHQPAGPLAVPVLFPPAGGTVAMHSFENEWPNPLTSCPGYSIPAGLPLTIQVGRVIDASLSAYSIARDGVPLQACGIDASNYRNPVASEQERVRQVLHSLGAVVIIPRQALFDGRYDASATVNGREYKWSFTIGK